MDYRAAYGLSVLVVTFGRRQIREPSELFSSAVYDCTQIRICDAPDHVGGGTPYLGWESELHTGLMRAFDPSAIRFRDAIAVSSAESYSKMLITS
jgi:hypothetical protein